MQTQPTIFETENETISSLEPSDHGHSPQILPRPLAEALKHGLGKCGDELNQQFKEGEILEGEGGEEVEMIGQEGQWMNSNKKRETGETDRERLLAYWEQNGEGGSRSSSIRGLQLSNNQPPEVLQLQTRPGIRRPRPNSSNQRPLSSQTIMSFATGQSSTSGGGAVGNGWSSEWEDTRGRPLSASSEEAQTPGQGYSSAYSYGAELETPMEEDEEWQTPAERPDVGRFSFSIDEHSNSNRETLDEENGNDSDTEINDRFRNSIPSPQIERSHLLVPDQKNSPTSRKVSKASLLSAAAASSIADPELETEQEEGRSSFERRRISLLNSLQDEDEEIMGSNQDQDQEMKVQDPSEDERERMEIDDTVGLALEGPPESSHLQRWSNPQSSRPSSNQFSDYTPPASNSMRSSRISNRTDLSAEAMALHTDVERLRSGPSTSMIVDRGAADELFREENSRDAMEGVVQEEREVQPQPQPPTIGKRNRAASLMDRFWGRGRKGSESSTPISEWNNNSISSTDLQNTPKSNGTASSFFNSRIARPRAHSAAQPINRNLLSPSISQLNVQDRRISDAVMVDDDFSEGLSEQTAKPSRSSSITRRSLLRRKQSNSKFKNNQTPIPSVPRTLAHKRSATGSITNASVRSHSARSVRSKRSSGTSLRSSYKRENQETPNKNSNGEEEKQLLKVSPPSLSLRRKGSPMPIRSSYLSEQRRPLPLPPSASASASTSTSISPAATPQTNFEIPEFSTSKKLKPKLARIGLGRRNSEVTESGGVWEDVETVDGSYSRKANEITSEASPSSLSPNNSRRWSGGWSWSKRSPNVPVGELPPAQVLPVTISTSTSPSQSQPEVSQIRAISPLAHIESHGDVNEGNLPSSTTSSVKGGVYRSPSSSFSSLAPIPTPALPPPPRKSNRRRTDSSSQTSSNQQSPSEVNFPNLVVHSRKGSLPESLPSNEGKRFSNSSGEKRISTASTSSSNSPYERTASPSSPRLRTTSSPSLAPIVSGLAAFPPSSSPIPSGRNSLDEVEIQAKRSRGDSDRSTAISDAETKEILLSENDSDLDRHHNSIDSEIEAQSFHQLLTPKSSPSQQQRRSRNGIPIPIPALSPVKEASIHKTPSFVSSIHESSSKAGQIPPPGISPSSSTVNLKSTMVGPAPISPSSNAILQNKSPNSNSLAAQKSAASFQKHAGEDASYSASSPSTSLRTLLSMHPQARVRKPSQAESDVSLMSANGKVLDSASLASAPTTTSPGRRHGSQGSHSHSRSLSGGLGGAEDRLSTLLVENQIPMNLGEHNNFGNSLPRTPRRPLPPIPDHAPIQTRGSRSFSLPSSKVPAPPTNAELRAWKDVEGDSEIKSPKKVIQHKAVKNLMPSKQSGSSLAEELGLDEDTNLRQRTFSAPTIPGNSKASTNSSSSNSSFVPFPNSGVQASLAALAALESRGNEEEDPRAAWARERILGIKDASNSVVSRLSVHLKEPSGYTSRKETSEEISGSEIIDDYLDLQKGGRDRRRASPYSTEKELRRRSRREGSGRSSDGGYSSSARGGRERSGNSRRGDGFHQRDFTGMATASSASLAEFNQSTADESDGTAALRNSGRNRLEKLEKSKKSQSDRKEKTSSRSIPPFFLISPPMGSNQVEESREPKKVVDWDEMIVPALAKRIEQEKLFELQQAQQQGGGSQFINAPTTAYSSSNFSSAFSPTLVSTSSQTTNPISSSIESRTKGVPFPRESHRTSPRASKLFPSDSPKSNRRRSSNQSSRAQEREQDSLYQEERNRRRSETSRHHHQSSPKQSRSQVSENKYGSLSSSFRAPSSPNLSFSQLSSIVRPPSPSQKFRSLSHEISSNPNSASRNQKSRTPTTSSLLNLNSQNGRDLGSTVASSLSSRRNQRKPSKQGFSGEDILAWQSSISSGFVG